MSESRSHQTHACSQDVTSKYIDNVWDAIPPLENSPVYDYVNDRGFLDEGGYTDCHATSDYLALTLALLGVEGRRCYGYMPSRGAEDELTRHHSWVEVRRDDMLELMSPAARANYERLEQNCTQHVKDKTRGLEWMALDAKSLNPDGHELLHLPLRSYQRSIFLQRTVARIPFPLFMKSTPLPWDGDEGGEQ